jgi:hypothetical protein
MAVDPADRALGTAHRRNGQAGRPKRRDSARCRAGVATHAPIWIVDPAGPQGMAASNAISVDVP